MKQSLKITFASILASCVFSSCSDLYTDQDGKKFRVIDNGDLTVNIEYQTGAQILQLEKNRLPQDLSEFDMIDAITKTPEGQVVYYIKGPSSEVISSYEIQSALGRSMIFSVSKETFDEAVYKISSISSHVMNRTVSP